MSAKPKTADVYPVASWERAPEVYDPAKQCHDPSGKMLATRTRRPPKKLVSLETMTMSTTPPLVMWECAECGHVAETPEDFAHSAMYGHLLVCQAPRLIAEGRLGVTITPAGDGTFSVSVAKTKEPDHA